MCCDLKRNTAREQVQVNKRLLQDLAKGKQLTVENRFYVELPLSAAHTQHTLDGLSVMAQPIHPQIIQWIKELIGEGVANCKEMQATLSLHVKTRMTDTVAPNDLDLPPALPLLSFIPFRYSVYLNQTK